MKTKDVMYDLLERLNNKGFTLYYLRAFSTTSCYIKLDFGIANSIRIADHKGIEKYKYRFNLMLNLDKSYEEDGRYYYCLKDLDKLIKDVVFFKNEQLNKYGFRYYEYMLNEKKSMCDKKGFWQNAKSYND